jgi:hypothetical protein
MAGAALKRVRTPHYISGLGDGNVQVKQQLHQNPDFGFDKPNIRRRHDQDRLAEQEHPLINERWDEYASNHPVARHKTKPWQFSTFPLLLTVVVLTALFLHVVSDAQRSNYKKKSKRNVPPRKIRKKTDEWNEDTNSNQGPSSQSTTEEDVQPIYYSYQPPEPALQQYRHRKPLQEPQVQPIATSFAPPKYHATHSRTGTPSSSRNPRPVITLNPNSVLPDWEPPESNSYSHVYAAPPHQRRLRPLPLSSVSSFESDEAAQQSVITTPTLTSTNSPPAAGAEMMHHLLLSPGHDDMMASPPIIAETPRAGNRRTIVDTRRYNANSETTTTSQPSSSSHLVLPLLPLQPQATSRPPRSIPVEDLHLYQMMESGNVSHWQERVAEESRQLQDQVFSSNEGDDKDNGAITNDPRLCIHHKRTDLTSSTDAASSLQSVIEFSELKLVEVVGGGGFGQVWRAVWNGTPVAVKVLTGSAQSKNIPKSVLQEFVAEINLLKGMRHPNICLYMGACLDPPNRAIITELAANGSLWDALRLPLLPPFHACDGTTRQAWPLRLYEPDSKHGAPPSPASRVPPPLPPRDSWPWELVKRVACGTARGMAYLHGGKPPVLHRDLKVGYGRRA